MFFPISTPPIAREKKTLAAAPWIPIWFHHFLRYGSSNAWKHGLGYLWVQTLMRLCCQGSLGRCVTIPPCDVDVVEHLMAFSTSPRPKHKHTGGTLGVPIVQNVFHFAVMSIRPGKSLASSATSATACKVHPAKLS